MDVHKSAVFAQRSADIVNERRNLREGEVILELVQFGLGEDLVNGVEDIALEAGGPRHGRDGRASGFLDDVVEHLLILGQWAGDEKPSARLSTRWASPNVKSRSEA
jgi:hypothetical protein